MEKEKRGEVMNLSNTRLDYIDIAKGIGILLVLLGHILTNEEWLKKVIYSFHMPLFFIVSGMVLKPKPIMQRIKSRTTDILVPYIIWATIFCGFSFKNMAYIFYGTNESLLLCKSNGMLWFLPCMFFATIIVQIILTGAGKTGHKNIILASCMVCALAASMIMNKYHSSIAFHGNVLGYPFAADIVLLSVSFMLFGNIFASLKQKNAVEFKWWHLLIYAACIAVSVIQVLFKTYGNYPQMATGKVGNMLIFFVVACVVCIGVIGVSAAIERFRIAKTALVWFGSNTMGLFIIHRTIREYFMNIHAHHPSVLLLIAMWLVLIAYSGLITMLINKMCPALFGKQPKLRD